MLGIGEHIAVGLVQRPEFKPFARASGTEGLDIFDIENHLHQRLAHLLGLSCRMEHEAGTAVRGDELDNPVVLLPERLESEMLFVEPTVASTSRA